MTFLGRSVFCTSGFWEQFHLHEAHITRCSLNFKFKQVVARNNMVEIDTQKDNQMEEDQNKSALREERQRTGRYIAVGAAIFLSLLGLYQAVARGTPQYAALFTPALIMFVYILWILYASKHQRKSAQKQSNPRSLIEISVENSIEPEGNCDSSLSTETCKYSRSYSIA